MLSWRAPGEAFHRIKDEVKGCEKARWDPDDKVWTVRRPSKSLRNANTLGYLTKGSLPETNGQELLRLAKPSQPVQVDWSGTLGETLFPYQDEDLRYFLAHRNVVFGYDMGLGKTYISICAMEIIKKYITQDPNRVVGSDIDMFWAIGPKSALKAWESMLKVSNVTPQLITNSPQAIERAMVNAPYPPLVLTVDESAHFKSDKAKRTQLLIELALRQKLYWRDASYLTCLSGTPAPKDPTDWWAQLEVTAPAIVRENSRSKLLQRLAYTETREGQHGSYTQVTGWDVDEIQQFYRRMKSVLIVRKKQDVAQHLPPKQYIRRILKPAPEIIATAKMLASQLSGVEARQAIRQLSDGFQYEHEIRGTDYKRVRIGAKRYHSPKLDALNDDLEELETNEQTRVVIWAAYQEAIDLIVEQCIKRGWAVIKADGRGWKGIEYDGFTPEPTQDQFQVNDLDKPIAFVANPGSAGEGLTLDKANTAIFYSNPDKGKDRMQAEDRIHRVTSGHDSFRIIDYIHLPTDDIILQQLQKKRDLQDLSMGRVIDALALTELENG